MAAVFVRVKLPNGALTTVTADHAQVHGLEVVDRPAVDAHGRPLAPKLPLLRVATAPAGASTNPIEENE